MSDSAFTPEDTVFMQRALELAEEAARQGEVPVGAVLAHTHEIIAEGWNQPIANHDPTAHAEIMAIRNAGQSLENYRLPGSVLYVTLEPCVMCAGAIIHARIERVVFATKDPRTGAAGSVFDLLPSDERFNHHTRVESGLMAEASSHLLKQFFSERRHLAKQEKSRQE